MPSDMIHSIDIDAPADKIYEAIASQAGLRAFWIDTAETSGELGSTATFTFAAHGGTVFQMRIDALEPGRRIAWHCLGEPPPWVGTELSWEIGPGEMAQSAVLFRHSGWSDQVPAAALGNVNTTWGQVVMALKGYVETGAVNTYFKPPAA